MDIQNISKEGFPKETPPTGESGDRRARGHPGPVRQMAQQQRFPLIAGEGVLIHKNTHYNINTTLHKKYCAQISQKLPLMSTKPDITLCLNSIN